MKTITTYIQWALTSLVLAASIMFMTACDFNFGVSVNGKNVNVTGIAGTADEVKAELSVGGKSYHAKIHQSLVPGDNGCVDVVILVGGKVITKKICGLQPGQRYDFDMEVDGGGMVAIQVPMAFAAYGKWTLHNGITGHDIPVMFSDKPFGYTPFTPITPEPGKKIVFAKWDPATPDSVYMGTLVGEFIAPPIGADVIKFILCGQVRFKLPGTTIGMKIGADSNYIFAELPEVYEFSKVGGMAAVPIQIASNYWHVLSAKEVSDLGLPAGGATKCVGGVPMGAKSTDFAPDFTLIVNGKLIHGAKVAAPIISGGDKVVVGFSRSDFYSAADSTKDNPGASLIGTLTTTGYPTNVNAPGMIPREAAVAGVNDNTGYISSGVAITASYPNPFDRTTTLTYQLATDGVVSIALYNNMGTRVQLIDESRQSVGTHNAQIDASTLPSGKYRVEVRTNGSRVTREIVVMH